MQHHPEVVPVPKHGAVEAGDEGGGLGEDGVGGKGGLALGAPGAGGGRDAGAE